MQRLDLNDEERAKLGQHALSFDAQEREILAGLTREESEWLVTDLRARWQQRAENRRAAADKRRTIELEEKHRVAHLRAVELATSKPQGSA